MTNHHPEWTGSSSRGSGASHRQDNTRAILSKLANGARGVVNGQVAAAQGGRWLGAVARDAKVAPNARWSQEQHGAPVSLGAKNHRYATGRTLAPRGQWNWVMPLATKFLFTSGKNRKYGLAPLCVSTSGQQKTALPLFEILNTPLPANLGRARPWSFFMQILAREGSSGTNNCICMQIGKLYVYGELETSRVVIFQG